MKEISHPEYALPIPLLLYNLKEQGRDVEQPLEIMLGPLGIELMYGYKIGMCT